MAVAVEFVLGLSEVAVWNVQLVEKRAMGYFASIRTTSYFAD